MTESVDPSNNHVVKGTPRRRARLLVCDEDGTSMRLAELPADVEAARRAYRSQYTADMRDSWRAGAVEYGGDLVGEDLHVDSGPWYDFKRSLGRPRTNLPPADLDGLPVDADRQVAEGEA